MPIFLSTDLGCEIDDQWPLLHLLGDPRFDLRVIATAQAPADAVPPPPAEVSAKLARHILRDRLQRADPPAVVAGSNQPLADGRTPRPSAALDALLEASRSFGPGDRLTVLVIGAATDVASALLKDPTLAERISIVAMGFRSAESGDEFNIKNDPHAWRIILASRVPVAAGDLSVTSRRLSLTKEEAKALLDGAGPLGAWLLRDYETWHDRVTRNFQNPGRPESSPSWPIWDEVVVAHLLGKTRIEIRARPRLTDDMKLVAGGEGTVTWVTDIDREAIFSEFRSNLLRLGKGRDLVDHDCVTIAREANACWRRPE
jgi:inosine-uridine nucleoside N-ribohydrolase